MLNLFKKFPKNKKYKKRKIIKINSGIINFKDSFFNGLFTLIPIVSTIYLIKLLFQLGDNFLGNFIRDNFVHHNVPGVGLLASALLIIITGYLIRVKWIHKIYKKTEDGLSKIPLVDKIYFSIKQVVNAFTSKSNRVFNSVVLVEYPNIGIYTIGLETGYGSSEMNQKTDNDLVSVFIPTTPNPATGNVFFIPRHKLVYLDLKVETAIKIIVSAGVVSHDE